MFVNSGNKILFGVPGIQFLSCTYVCVCVCVCVCVLGIALL